MYFEYWWPSDRFNGDTRLRSGNGNGNQYVPSSGWRGNSMYILFNGHRNYLFKRFGDGPFHRLWNDLFDQLRDISLNSFRDDNFFRFAATFCIVVFSRRFCRTHFCSYKWRRRLTLANWCSDIFGHRLILGACLGMDRNTFRSFRFRGTYQGGLVM